MPIAAAQLQKLDGFLKGVSPATAARLAQAVEYDRARGGALPHEAILEALRPHLRNGPALQRVLTAQRAVCACFEDILVDGRRRKQRGRIARESIKHVWSWLALQLGEDGARAVDAISVKLAAAGVDFAQDEIAAFHGIASAAILSAVPAPDAPGPAARALGSDVAADAHDMGRMMQIGADIRELQLQLERPVASLGEEEIWTIRAVWERVLAEKPDCAPYIGFFVMGRLQKPWEIMRLAGALSRKMDDILISRTDAGQVGELLLSDLEDCVAQLGSIRPDAMVAARVVDAVARFSLVSTGIVRELGIKRDGIWGKRLMAARADMADQMERLLARALRDISATLPMSRRGGLTLRTRRTPDMTKQLDPERAVRAIEIASVLAGSRPHALAGAFAGLLSEIEEKVTDLLRHYTEEMVDELRTVAEPLRPQAAAFVAHATQLTRIVLGAEEGELVRRRAAAAISAQSETMVA